MSCVLTFSLFKLTISESYILNEYRIHINSLDVALSAQCTLQNTWDLSGHPLLCMSVADDFSGQSVFSASRCVSSSQLPVPKD